MVTLNVAHAGLIAVGAFYAFAGFVGIRAALHGRLLDIAIAGISLKKPPFAETARGLWLLLSAGVVLAGGLFLILRLDWAAAAFVAAALGQAVYLLILAPLYFDAADPPDAKGRQQTINAFILYSAATLLVLWAYRTGKLMGPGAVGWPLVWGGLAALGVSLVWGLYRFYWPLASSPLAAIGAGAESEDLEVPNYTEDDETGPPLSESRRILVMSEYECDPLWTHDPGRSGTISPNDLSLSDALIADLDAWAHNYNGSFNLDDPSHPNWNEAQYLAHDQAGLDLARRLKRELPDRQIFVWRTGDGNYGHTEIRAADI